MISRLLDWLPFRRWHIVGRYQDLDELPDDLPRRGAALVSAPGRLKWIVFDCPCGTGHRIMLNGDHSRRPFWRVVSSSPLSIAPSVDFRGTERRCHYFIRSGRTMWAKDSDR